MATGPMLLAAFLLAAPAESGAVPTADTAAAAAAFDEVCLRSESADQARQKVQAAGYVQGDTLPGLMGGAPLETYSKSPLEIGIRSKKSGDFSCLVIFAPDAAADNAAVATAVTALPGVALLSSKGSAKQWRATWTPLRSPKGSKVYLTIHHGIGHRSAILTLEAEAAK